MAPWRLLELRHVPLQRRQVHDAGARRPRTRGAAIAAIGGIAGGVFEGDDDGLSHGWAMGWAKVDAFSLWKRKGGNLKTGETCVTWTDLRALDLYLPWSNQIWAIKNPPFPLPSPLQGQAHRHRYPAPVVVPHGYQGGQSFSGWVECSWWGFGFPVLEEEHVDTHTHMYIYIYMFIYSFIYLLIYIEREGVSSYIYIHTYT